RPPAFCGCVAVSILRVTSRRIWDSTSVNGPEGRNNRRNQIVNRSNIDQTNSIHRWGVPRAFLVIAVALAAFTSASGSPDFANVIGVNFRPGGTNFGLTVSIPKGLHSSSRAGDANFDVRVTLTYVSARKTVETIDFGRIPIRTGTSFIRPIDDRTAAI